jgi:hypothetical protein
MASPIAWKARKDKPGFSMGNNRWVEFLVLDYDESRRRIEKLRKEPVFTEWQPAPPVILEDRDPYEKTQADEWMAEYLERKANEK